MPVRRALAFIFAVALVATLSWSTSALALTTTSNMFDQVQKVNDLGGTVYELPGAANQMFDSGDFIGPVSTSTGVQVTLPGYEFASSYANFNDGGSSEPGNLPSLMLGSPTDVTFTLPGSGGPDGTNGDGSVQLVTGGYVDLFFATLRTGTNSDSDIFIFTNTANTGTADVTLLLGGLEVLGESVNTMFPMGTAASGTGGILLDVAYGVAFDGIRIDNVMTSAEIDGVAAIPEPATGLLVMLGLAGLARARRRLR